MTVQALGFYVFSRIIISQENAISFTWIQLNWLTFSNKQTNEKKKIIAIVGVLFRTAFNFLRISRNMRSIFFFHLTFSGFSLFSLKYLQISFNFIIVYVFSLQILWRYYLHNLHSFFVFRFALKFYCSYN